MPGLQHVLQKKAPFHDLQFCKELIKYKTIDASISKAACGKIKNHLWYLNLENVSLSFFDENILIDDKKEMKMSLRISCRVDDADKHENDITSLIYKNGKLYSGADDGKIKAWSTDLTKLAECSAHQLSIYSLAANNNELYSCSSDGTVKAFTLDTLSPKGNVIHEDHTEFWKLFYSQDCLYAGDDEGSLKIWKDGTFYGSLLLAEPIKDMAVSHHIVFTVKDTDVVITEVKVDHDVLQFGQKKTCMGRAPLTLIGDKLFAFSSRDGKDIIVHENNDHTHYKEVAKIEAAHNMVINALAGTSWDDKSVLFSSGWDKILKKWIIDEDIVKMSGSLDVGMVVNAIAIGDKGEIYVGGADGHIIRVEIE
ncbi:hypothetical protein NQ317_002011 [Molorchus minor]|uniref:Uncharacterized protein n=1 Tax=Molorchus minor TaxID=1323400 RepID=A0ABQ9IS70_9CUCU|nr:hypothetical protein NQ317_002011 [Molorchus minor]